MADDSSAGWISEYDPSFPDGSVDSMNVVDNQLRMLKASLKAQFPNLGTSAVTPTAAELNLLVGLTAVPDLAAANLWEQTQTIKTSVPLVFEGATEDAFEVALAINNPTADRTWYLPDASDTFVGLALAQTLSNKTLTAPIANSPVLNTAISGFAFLDEDNMASNSATKVASQQSIKAYVDNTVAAAVAKAPNTYVYHGAVTGNFTVNWASGANAGVIHTASNETSNNHIQITIANPPQNFDDVLILRLLRTVNNNGFRILNCGSLDDGSQTFIDLFWSMFDSGSRYRSLVIRRAPTNWPSGSAYIVVDTFLHGDWPF